MTNSVVALCYLIFLILALISPFLPIYAMLRIGVLSIGFFGIGKLVEGPVHWSDKDFGYAIGMAMLTFFIILVLAGIMIRIALAKARKHFNAQAAFNPNNILSKTLEMLIIAVIGVMIGLIMIMLLAQALSGVNNGRNLDLGIAVFAASFAVVCLFVSNKLWASFSFAALLTLAVLAGVGSYQTNRILNAAETVADGRAYCFTTANQSRPINSLKQLGFFSLPKLSSYPHLGLVVFDEGKAQLIKHWSIRQQAYISANGVSGYIPTCHPIKNYITALETGKINSNVYAVGNKTYHIPPHFQPRAYISRLIIQQDIFVESSNSDHRTMPRLELNYNFSKPYISDDAISLEKMPNFNEIDINKLKDSLDIVVAGTDETTGMEIVIECFVGTYRLQPCRANALNNKLAYSFPLPLDKVHEWKQVMLQVEALFQSLEVSDL